jgi:hypothetical protein
MKKIICLLLLGASAAASHAEIIYREELEAPDVDFYITLHGTRTDFSDLGASQQNGVRIRLGVEMKEAILGSWRFRAEGGLNQFGQASKVSTSFRDPGEFPPEEYEPEVDVVQIDERREIRLGGIELGAALYNSRRFYVRGGVFLHSLKTRDQETRTALDDDNSVLSTNKLSPAEQSRSSIQPYLGVGMEIPVVRSVNASAEWNAYRIEGEYLSNLALGLQFRY